MINIINTDIYILYNDIVNFFDRTYKSNFHEYN